MKYDKMWYKFKEDLMNMSKCGEVNVDDLLMIMNRIEVEENRENDKPLISLKPRTGTKLV